MGGRRAPIGRRRTKCVHQHAFPWLQIFEYEPHGAAYSYDVTGHVEGNAHSIMIDISRRFDHDLKECLLGLNDTVI